jgi:hypothetical protein
MEFCPSHLGTAVCEVRKSAFSVFVFFLVSGPSGAKKRKSLNQYKNIPEAFVDMLLETYKERLNNDAAIGRTDITPEGHVLADRPNHKRNLGTQLLEDFLENSRQRLIKYQLRGNE